jgi:hypothetical protein
VIRVVVGVEDRPPVFVHEQPIGRREGRARGVLAHLDPRAQRPHDTGIERPPARVVGLVLVQLDRSALKIHVGEREGRGLRVRAAALTREEPVEDAPAERHPRAREELAVSSG